MTKKEFKELWESNDDGGGITFQDIADCAIEWGITTSPYMSNRHEIRYSVLLDAGVNDAEYYNPHNNNLRNCYGHQRTSKQLQNETQTRFHP